MPRPSSVTDADIARWEQRYQDYIAAHGKDPAETTFFGDMDRSLSFAVGEWVAEQLQARGCEEPLLGKILMALGQRSFQADLTGGDLWDVALKYVADYDNGLSEVGGPVLAEKIFQELLPEFKRRGMY